MPLTARGHVDFLHSQTWLASVTHLYRFTAILRSITARDCLNPGRAVHRLKICHAKKFGTHVRPDSYRPARSIHPHIELFKNAA